MRIAVVLCTRNRPRELGGCLTSVLAQTFPCAELVVVDSSESDDTARLIQAMGVAGQVETTYVKSSPGLPTQRNIGIRAIRSSPDVVCFFDDDVELDREYLKAIATRLSLDVQHSIVGVCGSALNERKRSIVDRLVRRLFLITDNATGRLLRSGDAGHIFAPDSDTSVSVLSGCNMCFRKEILSDEGLRFDELLNGYAFMEDQDFSIRASHFGLLYQIIDARLYHHVTPQSRPTLRMMHKMYIVNSFYLFRKNLAPKKVDYLWYGWRLVGKLIQASMQSLANLSVQPVLGWVEGIMQINSLSGSDRE
jgi:glycosyltransferase involved in cell wall biosynthesis